MKRILAIIILSVYLFNVAGYSLYYHYCIYDSDIKQQAKIEMGEYENAELREIRIPLNMPYYSASAAYESVTGEVEINGAHYNYVKRKVSGDTLFLLCLLDFTKTQLFKEKNDYSDHANNLPGNKHENNGKKVNLSFEYLQPDINMKPLGFIIPMHDEPALQDMSALDGFQATPDQPPRSV